MLMIWCRKRRMLPGRWQGMTIMTIHDYHDYYISLLPQPTATVAIRYSVVYTMESVVSFRPVNDQFDVLIAVSGDSRWTSRETLCLSLWAYCVNLYAGAS
eukprot:scaffold127590_cov19-Prasinocladus_malaysianus.AAC.1